MISLGNVVHQRQLARENQSKMAAFLSAKHQNQLHKNINAVKQNIVNTAPIVNPAPIVNTAKYNTNNNKTLELARIKIRRSFH